MSTRAEHQARRTIRRHDPGLAEQLDRIVPLGPEPESDVDELKAQLRAMLEKRDLLISKAQVMMIEAGPRNEREVKSLLSEGEALSRAAGDLAFVISQEERLLALATTWRPHA